MTVLQFIAWFVLFYVLFMAAGLRLARWWVRRRDR
jgi:hypothetical protein